jgi:GxxExxY protein
MPNKDLLQYVINAAAAALKKLGPHHSETVYEQAICYDLYQNDITHLRQVPVFEQNCGRQLLVGYVDVEIKKSIVVELKANFEKINDTHVQQIYRYKRAYTNNAVYDGALLFVVILFTKSGQLQTYIAK